MPQTVLLVTYHYLPAATPGSRRVETLARLLSQRGWECIVLTGTGHRDDAPDTPGIEVIRTTRHPLHGDGVHPGVARPAISRIPVAGKWASFPDRYAAWGPGMALTLLRLLRTRRIDVVMSSSPPHSMHVAITAARTVRRFPWVAEFRDPWMFPSRRLPGRVSAAVQRRMERRVLGLADCIIANTPGNRDALLADNPDLNHARVRVSTNGYDAALFAPGSFRAATGESADITYVGEVYEGMLTNYLAALVSIRARNPEHVPRLAVYGTLHPSDRRRIADLGLDSYVEDRGFVSHEQSIEAMKDARALLVLLPPEDRWRTCVPSKLYWYLAARRPIVAVVPEGDTARLVRDLQVGKVFPETDPESIGRRLESFVIDARSRPQTLLGGEATARFAMESITDDIDSILREVTDGDPT